MTATILSQTWWMKNISRNWKYIYWYVIYCESHCLVVFLIFTGEPFLKNGTFLYILSKGYCYQEIGPKPLYDTTTIDVDVSVYVMRNYWIALKHWCFTGVLAKYIFISISELRGWNRGRSLSRYMCILYLRLWSCHTKFIVLPCTLPASTPEEAHSEASTAKISKDPWFESPTRYLSKKYVHLTFLNKVTLM